MERCGTCLHWRKAFDFEDDANRFRRCHRIKDEDGVFGGHYIADEAERTRLMAAELAVACDAESYAAWLDTAANFGCVLHEPKT